VSQDATQEPATYDDGKFIRTALVASDGKAGSFDVVAEVHGQRVRLAQINLFYFPRSDAEGGGDRVIVDVIDVDRRYRDKFAIGFSQTERARIDMPSGGSVFSVDFSNQKKG
jgi:hypothetical protein